MTREWASNYAKCPTLGTLWRQVGDAQADALLYPEGLHVLGDKMYLHGKLCVPQPLELEYMLEHQRLQHASVNKQDADFKRRTHTKDIRQKVADIRRHCEVCQSCTHANYAKPEAYHPFPVPTRPFESVATDIFTRHPAKHFRGTTCTKMVL